MRNHRLEKKTGLLQTKITQIFILFSAICLLISFSYAEIPKTLNFQGRLTDKEGKPLQGNYSLDFSIYDVSSGGSPIWTETQTVSVSEGIYNCILGSNTPLNLGFDKPYYLEVSVSGQTLSPRQKLSSSAYSLNSERLAGLPVTSFVRVDTNGNVGIGVPTPQAKLDVAGVIQTNAYPGLKLTHRDSQIRFWGESGEKWGIGSTGAAGDDLLFYDAKAGAIRMLIDDATGNVGIGTTNPGARLDVRGQIIGGFGATTTGGVLDWNDTSNVRSGSGYTLLLGTATNGPGPGTYFHPFNFEYISKDGSGNVTQFAIPYGATSHMNSGLYMRGRYGGTWSNWMRIIAENNSGNVGIGTTKPEAKLEINATGLSGPGGWLKGVHFTSTAHSAITLTNPTGGGLLFGFHGINQKFYFGHYKPDGTWDKYNMVVDALTGNVGIGTTSPQERLHVDGKVKAKEFITGDITFTDKSTGEILWRMFEDEQGLYLENQKTGKIYRFLLEEVKK